MLRSDWLSELLLGYIVKTRLLTQFEKMGGPHPRGTPCNLQLEVSIPYNKVRHRGKVWSRNG